MRIYGGTISTSDRNVLSIFYLYGAEKLSPTGRREVGLDEQVYDPLFVILFVVQNVCASSSGFVARMGADVPIEFLSLLIRCLSATDEKIREASLGLLVWKSVEVPFKHAIKQHALYIFNLLKNLVKPSPNGPHLRLSSLASLILSHALRGVFYPSNFIYSRTARFLLQRPELDVTDVPMLYNMFYGTSDDWKEERGWIVRFLSDGMTSTEDGKVLRRRHLSSLVQSSVRDQALRCAVLEVLADLTSNAQATTSLVLKSSLLS
ncbi:hypothetical protein CY34DRAFT_18221 [Suillus luteus UH-Slu-Lm8-n1]|uniref:URB1 C-terminal domain-containing protein n=1 Tax=Suillus luteus UH-Slu-Lm8-n1 TaxID=930992 RepID=A0A0C9Z823_9AGAM|nr:hypothetical protein CY34DRAFT_18221 [Suillus luteus UH-Slu-Lm8-n1]